MNTSPQHKIADIETLVEELDFASSGEDMDVMMEKALRLERAMIQANWSYDERLQWCRSHITYVYSTAWTMALKRLIKNALEGREQADALEDEMRKLSQQRKKSFTKKLQNGVKGVSRGGMEIKFEPKRMYLSGEQSSKMIHQLPQLSLELVHVGAIGAEDKESLTAFFGGDVEYKIVKPIQWLLPAKYLNYLLTTMYNRGIWQESITRTEMFARAASCFQVKGNIVSASSLRANKDVKGDAEDLFDGMGK